MIDIFVDGSCINNGSARAKAAYAWVKAVDGVFTHQNAKRITDDDPHTNQYAELCAFQDVFAHIQDTGIESTTIYSDSMYSINCITLWGPKWKSQGWKRKAGGSGGKPLEHLDIIRPLVDFWEIHKDKIDIKYVAAHQTAAVSKTYPYSGNALADRLAREKAEE